MPPQVDRDQPKSFGERRTESWAENTAPDWAHPCTSTIGGASSGPAVRTASRTPDPPRNSSRTTCTPHLPH